MTAPLYYYESIGLADKESFSKRLYFALYTLAKRFIFTPFSFLKVPFLLPKFPLSILEIPSKTSLHPLVSHFPSHSPIVALGWP